MSIKHKLSYNGVAPLDSSSSSPAENVPNASVEVHVKAHICPQLWKKLDLVSEYLIQGKNVDLPFTPYQTKKQKKQIIKLNSYNTRSRAIFL
jgi:hypothetical protein